MLLLPPKLLPDQSQTFHCLISRCLLENIQRGELCGLISSEAPVMYRNVTLHTSLIASPALPLPPYPISEGHGLFTLFASAMSIFRVIHFNSTKVIHNIVTNRRFLWSKEGKPLMWWPLPFVTNCQRSNRVPDSHEIRYGDSLQDAVGRE